MGCETAGGGVDWRLTGVGVKVGVVVGVPMTRIVGDGVEVSGGVGEGWKPVGVGVEVTVGEAVTVAVGEPVGVGVEVTVGEAVTVAVGEPVGVTVALGETLMLPASPKRFEPMAFPWLSIPAIWDSVEMEISPEPEKSVFAFSLSWATTPEPVFGVVPLPRTILATPVIDLASVNIVGR